MYTCMYICMYICVDLAVSKHKRKHVRGVCMYVGLLVCMCMYECMCVRVSARLTRVYVCMYACVYSSMFVQGPRVTKQTQGEEGVFATLFGVVDFFFLFIFWSLLKKFTPRIGVPNTTPNKVTNKIVQHGTKKKVSLCSPPSWKPQA